MNWNDLEKHFSAARLGRYSAARGGDTTKAAADYSSNLLLSEAMVPMLNVLEIALRNGIHARLSKLYGRRDWWEAWQGDPGFDWQNKQVTGAKGKLRRNEEPQTVDKVLAELTFGFWSSLFNAQFQDVLWKDLRLVFARCPKAERQRRHISSALNQIRDLRNRVFHHEPLLWLSPELLAQHQIGVMVINWVDPQLGVWLEGHDRLPAAWTVWKGEG
ncbi:hypothetical protein [Aeromonas hydrophila]|uniref:hypothetical protein n=1 Tax=Aeromonas TaxID=642 RepID=UPI0007448DE8|nr:hypothetical protein [Aeromonas hydrophila]ALZ82498.1 hypothetical protein AhyD4_23060 [Aeromonas hydrophila]